MYTVVEKPVEKPLRKTVWFLMASVLMVSSLSGSALAALFAAEYRGSILFLIAAVFVLFVLSTPRRAQPSRIVSFLLVMASVAAGFSASLLGSLVAHRSFFELETLCVSFSISVAVLLVIQALVLSTEAEHGRMEAPRAGEKTAVHLRRRWTRVVMDCLRSPRLRAASKGAGITVAVLLTLSLCAWGVVHLLSSFFALTAEEMVVAAIFVLLLGCIALPEWLDKRQRITRGSGCWGYSEIGAVNECWYPEGDPRQLTERS